MDVLQEVETGRIAALRERDEFFWLDLERPSDSDLDAMAGVLSIHPLALEDTREFGQRPKLDAYEDHVLLVYYTVRDPLTEAEGLVEPVEIHLYISGGFVVTVRREECSELDHLHEMLVPEDTAAEDYLVYRILDALTDAFYPALERLEVRIDALEGEVLARPDREHLAQIHRLKQEVHELLRRVAPQRDRFHTGSEIIVSLPGLTRGSREYLRDVADHLAQIAGELSRQHEDLMGLTSTYFNSNQNRLNAIATRFTVVATLFFTWTLVTGFFGQNFVWLVDSIKSRGDFLLFGVGGLVAPTILLGIVFYIKREDWF
ncbi:MAG TPA: magnesium transporter CorA family protein [Solirubrobacteraceae bacterium]|nr:magnesium transporter CorA family protein [Solirubrobacteraceae bacterium]